MQMCMCVPVVLYEIGVRKLFEFARHFLNTREVTVIVGVSDMRCALIDSVVIVSTGAELLEVLTVVVHRRCHAGK